MRVTNIVKVDSKGRVTIPLFVREALEIQEGRYLIAIADINKKEIILTPVTSSNKPIFEIKVELKDKPGALAEFSEKLKEMGLDQLIVRCSTIKRGEIGECISIVESINGSRNVRLTADAIKNELEKMDIVYFVSVKQIEKV